MPDDVRQKLVEWARPWDTLIPGVEKHRLDQYMDLYCDQLRALKGDPVDPQPTLAVLAAQTTAALWRSVRQANVLDELVTRRADQTPAGRLREIYRLHDVDAAITRSLFERLKDAQSVADDYNARLGEAVNKGGRLLVLPAKAVGDDV